jgi:putative transposase
VVKPRAKREAVEFANKSFGLSLRRSCAIIGLCRSTQRYKVKDPQRDDAIKERMREIVQEYPKWGCPMVHDILRREGLVINAKRTERIYYQEEKLSLLRRKRRRRAKQVRISLPEVSHPNQRWAMDFVHDSLWNGRKLRALTMVDVFTKESLRIEVNTSIGGEYVVRVLNQIAESRGLPNIITVDNGPEFRSKALDRWAYEKGVTLDFIRPGKPVDNCYIESFNSRFREECLNTHYFDSIMEARILVENWRNKYNSFRPHRSLKGQTPEGFAKKYQLKGTQNTNFALAL